MNQHWLARGRIAGRAGRLEGADLVGDRVQLVGNRVGGAKAHAGIFTGHAHAVVRLVGALIDEGGVGGSVGDAIGHEDDDALRANAPQAAGVARRGRRGVVIDQARVAAELVVRLHEADRRASRAGGVGDLEHVGRVVAVDLGISTRVIDRALRIEQRIDHARVVAAQRGANPVEAPAVARRVFGRVEVRQGDVIVGVVFLDVEHRGPHADF